MNRMSQSKLGTFAGDRVHSNSAMGQSDSAKLSFLHRIHGYHNLMSVTDRLATLAREDDDICSTPGSTSSKPESTLPQKLELPLSSPLHLLLSIRS